MQKIILVDDFDGTDADQTIRYGFDGLSYEIDLSDKNAEEFREIMKRYLAASRKVHPKPASPDKSADRARSGYPASRKTLQAWAAKKDMPFGDKGVIPKAVIDAYRAAHPEGG